MMFKNILPINPKTKIQKAKKYKSLNESPREYTL